MDRIIYRLIKYDEMPFFKEQLLRAYNMDVEWKHVLASLARIYININTVFT